MACPLGLSSRPALAAMRAGISRFGEVEDLAGPGGPVRASRWIGLDPGRSRTERAATFAGHALRESIAALDAAEPLPCFLALPERNVGHAIDPQLLTRACDGLVDGTGAPLRLDVRPERTFMAGRAGVFKALEQATALLASGAERYALIGGVDSLVDAETLADLADQDRLRGHTNPDGIIPGEGAAFVLLSRPGSSRRHPHRPPVHLYTPMLAHEMHPAAHARDRLSAADGLTAVFRQLRSTIEGRLDRVYAAVTSEACYGREFSYAYLRNASLMPEPLHHETISQTLGDVGAAAGAMCLVLAAARLSANQRALVYGSSDGGLVGATVVRAS